MANELTSLEAIALKLEEMRKTDLEAILSQSGSAMQSKNNYGVTVVDDSNIATSLLFKTLNKDKYDIEELIKAVNTEVKELAPNIPTANLNLVPKPLYDSEVSQSTDLRKQVKDLTTTVTTLNSTITTLETQVQTEINNRLGIEQSNDALTNQLDTLSNTINDFAGQISTSLQKSVEESILRASLQSQNTGFKAQIEALIKQIDSLNAIIEGLQAQLGAVQQQQAIQNSAANIAAASGADIINEVGLVKFTDKGNDSDGYIYGAVSTSGSGLNKWKYGEYMRFTNNDKFDITIRILTTFDKTGKWFDSPIKELTLKPGEAKDIQNIINGFANQNGLHYSKNQKSASHEGTINISVIRQDDSTKSKDYKTKLNLMHWKSFPGF
jgi:hypothetical protein